MCAMYKTKLPTENIYMVNVLWSKMSIFKNTYDKLRVLPQACPNLKLFKHQWELQNEVLYKDFPQGA